MPEVTPQPRWALPILDAVVWLLAVAFSAVLRYDAYATAVPWAEVLRFGLAMALLFVGVAAVLHLYAGRHAVGSLDEAQLLTLIALGVGATATAVLFVWEPRPIPVSLPLAASAATALMVVASRVSYRLIREHSITRAEQLNAVVVGAGEAGTQLVKQMSVDRRCPYKAVCFVDDNPRKKHFRVGRVRVVGTLADLPGVIADQRIDRILVAAPSAGPELLRRVSRIAADTGVKARALPTLAEMADRDEVHIADLRDLELTDFLRRRPVATDLSEVGALLRGKRVLVTGAGGSIGSEICRQVAQFQPGQLFMLDRDESALHALQISLDGRGLLQDPGLVLADIRDCARLAEVFAHARPEVVFHAAALKHLTMLQRFPEEGLKTNVLGTDNVLRSARECGTEIVVNISTDKAADPTSVLGETKRAAEQLTAAVAEQSGHRYLSVRFGNVLGSRGSVLTAFTEQIRRGGPVTVTHPDVTRYFMTVQEAVQLVLQAAALGRPADTLILDMGEPVRILDVAHQMIAMSGRSIEVAITGLRPGEKLHEDLEGAAEELQPTEHPLISRTTVPPLDPAVVGRISIAADGTLSIGLPDTADVDRGPNLIALPTRSRRTTVESPVLPIQTRGT